MGSNRRRMLLISRSVHFSKQAKKMLTVQSVQCHVAADCTFIDFIQQIWRFWPILGDIGPFLRPDLGRKLGDGYQLQIYINQAFLRPWGDQWWFRTGLCCRIVEPKPLSCREAIEERTFAGHFWEPRSSDLGVVSFDGFMRSGRT
jgi:hypothetical protein